MKHSSSARAKGTGTKVSVSQTEAFVHALSKEYGISPIDAVFITAEPDELAKLAYKFNVQQNSYWAMFYAEFWRLVNFIVQFTHRMFAKEMGYEWIEAEVENDKVTACAFMLTLNESEASRKYKFSQMLSHLFFSIDAIIWNTPSMLDPVGMQHRFYCNMLSICELVAGLVEGFCNPQCSFLGGCNPECGGDVLNIGQRTQRTLHPKVRETIAILNRTATNRDLAMNPMRGAATEVPVSAAGFTWYWFRVRDMVINLNAIAKNAFYVTNVMVSLTVAVHSNVRHNEKASKGESVDSDDLEHKPHIFIEKDEYKKAKKEDPYLFGLRMRKSQIQETVAHAKDPDAHPALVHLGHVKFDFVKFVRILSVISDVPACHYLPPYVNLYKSVEKLGAEMPCLVEKFVESHFTSFGPHHADILRKLHEASRKEWSWLKHNFKSADDMFASMDEVPSMRNVDPSMYKTIAEYCAREVEAPLTGSSWKQQQQQQPVSGNANDEDDAVREEEEGEGCAEYNRVHKHFSKNATVLSDDQARVIRQDMSLGSIMMRIIINNAFFCNVNSSDGLPNVIQYDGNDDYHRNFISNTNSFSVHWTLSHVPHCDTYTPELLEAVNRMQVTNYSYLRRITGEVDSATDQTSVKVHRFLMGVEETVLRGEGAKGKSAPNKAQEKQSLFETIKSEAGEIFATIMNDNAQDTTSGATGGAKGATAKGASITYYSQPPMPEPAPSFDGNNTEDEEEQEEETDAAGLLHRLPLTIASSTRTIIVKKKELCEES